MAVGMWVTTVNIMGIMYHENMKILGIHFTSTTSQSALKSWSVVTDGLRTHAREPYYRELSLNKLIHFVHTYTLSRTWFTAQIFLMSPTCERQINTAITWSLWRGGFFRAPLSTLQRCKLHGGWDLINGNFRHRVLTRPRSNGYWLTLSTCSSSRCMNKQLLAAEKKWSSSLGVGRSATKSYALKLILIRNIHRKSLGPGLILWYDLSNEKETYDLVFGMLGTCTGQVHLQQQPGNWLDIK